MQITIESYKNILESYTQDDQTDIVKVRKEMISMQKQIEDLEHQRQKMIDERVVREDEMKAMSKSIDQYRKLEGSL